LKIILFFLTAIPQLGVAVFAFFMLLLGLNGYSERDATPALLAYIALSGVVVVATALAAVFTAKKFEQRMGKFGAGAVSVIGFTVVGVALIVVSLFVSVGVAEVVRSLR
jgi:cobalamin synthase